MLKTVQWMEAHEACVIIGFAVIMAVSLVIFYAPGGNKRSGLTRHEGRRLAEVGGEEVTVGDLSTLKESYMQSSAARSAAQLAATSAF